MNTRERVDEIIERINIKLLEPNKFKPFRIGFMPYELHELGISVIIFEGFLKHLQNLGFIQKFEVYEDDHPYMVAESPTGRVIYDDEYVGYFCLFIEPKEFEIALNKYKKINQRQPQAQKQIAKVQLKLQTMWENITIKFKDENNIEILENEKSIASANFRDFGCNNRDKADTQWKTLSNLSYGRGILKTKTDDMKTIKQISKLNDILKKVFNLPDRPIVTDEKRSGTYRSLFTIIPIPGLRKEEIWGARETDKRFAKAPEYPQEDID